IARSGKWPTNSMPLCGNFCANSRDTERKAMAEYRYLLVHHADGICTTTLNRPEVLNSWNEDMRVEMRSVMRDVQGDRRVRVLTTTGAGRAFSAGEDVIDIKSRQKAETTSRDFRVIARNIHNFLNELESIEIPVIAAINGVAAAGGMELA